MDGHSESRRQYVFVQQHPAAGKYTINTRHTTWSWGRQDVCKQLRYQASADHLNILQDCTVTSPLVQNIKSTFWAVKRDIGAALRCRWRREITREHFYIRWLLHPFLTPLKPDGSTCNLRFYFSSAAKCKEVCVFVWWTELPLVPSEEKSCVHAFHADESKRQIKPSAHLSVLSLSPSVSLHLLCHLT